ncbi:L-aspartate decarboxylase dtxS4 [Golovinomyces cichoracearum]|uniref:L-aspartate decarboxylase dtxS4 n=1 Tax=Golovinomyces cichoracearum TaxID=62708 RepID=A0A420HK90_9PEZI|nr:L-aspartate decarboxylase dtxS4 [Golovinomyces cichoracearum]
MSLPLKTVNGDMSLPPKTVNGNKSSPLKTVNGDMSLPPKIVNGNKSLPLKTVNGDMSLPPKFVNGNESLPLKTVNGNMSRSMDRAAELEGLLEAVQPLIIPFIRASDNPASIPMPLIPNEDNKKESPLVPPTPEKLMKLMKIEYPENGQGKEGLISTIEDLLKYSVNTWDRKFMDKLFAGTNAVGVISELILAVLNTNVHVFKVSPALTIVEKTTAKTFANFFGFNGPRAGGISTQGGSASNITSIIIARNNLYPESKKIGNSARKFVLFTSAEGHYSLEKASQVCGLGTDNIWPIPVDEYGCMIPSELEKSIELAKAESRTPFYVNATAGTTVLGSFDPFVEISSICKKHNLWMHVDASWGGPVIFSRKHKQKLNGVHLADSLGVNPHKMMGVPSTCSFLLTPDLLKFHNSNTLPAGYLFHSNMLNEEVWDLADLTLQCGRRADSLKLALSWIYYGSNGFEKQIDHAFSVAAYLATRISENPTFFLVSENPPPCLQVCFYYVGKAGLNTDPKFNNHVTSYIVHQMISKGFLVDYAPGQYGSFLRVVVNRESQQFIMDDLIKVIDEIGAQLEEISEP